MVIYTLRFISLNGFPSLYTDKVEELEIHDFRAVLPCDLVSIVQVRDSINGYALRAMTDTFYPKSGMEQKKCCTDLVNNVAPCDNRPPTPLWEMSFKTQGQLIYTSFPEGKIEICYKAIPVDDEGYPLLLDNETYLAALESYIKKTVFTFKFDQGKISQQVYQQSLQDYAWNAGMLDAEMKIPSISEMESITRMWNTLLFQPNHFNDTFRRLGDKEHLRIH